MTYSHLLFDLSHDSFTYIGRNGDLAHDVKEKPDLMIWGLLHNHTMTEATRVISYMIIKETFATRLVIH